MKQIVVFLAVMLCHFVNVNVYAQNEDTSKVVSGSSIENISNKTINKLERNYNSLEDKLVRSTEKTLKRFQRQELKLQKKIFSKDSIAALNLFNGTQTKYANYLQKLASPINKISSTAIKEYLPKFDSFKIVMRLGA